MTSLRLVRIYALSALVLLVAAASASADLLAPPVGPPPLRYRDAIFPNLTISNGLTYGSAPDGAGNPVTLTLDMFRPTGDTQTSRPAIVLIHGGGFSAGNSKNGAMVKMANAFAQRGYVAVSINYRLLNTTHEKCGVEAQPSQTCITAALAAQHDAQAAIRWLRRNAATYGIDPTRIAVGGGSAGAATALAVAVNSTDPGTSGNPGYSSKVGAAISISGALPGTFAKSFFDAADSATLMFEGTADTVVPYPAAAQTAAEMRSAGITVVFEALQGGGHVPMAAFGDVIISQSINFAYDQLNLARAAGQRTAAPRATITVPRNGATYAAGQLVKTSFSCAEGAGGPGLTSCRDATGTTTPGGRLDTTHPGRHTYKVIATSGDGFQGSASVTYQVKAPKLSHLMVSPHRFRATRRGPTLLRRGGAKITYRDPIAASTRVQVFRHLKRRLVAVGSFSHRDRGGTTTLHFSGHLGGHALAPGSYVLKASAALDGQRGGTLTASFRILPA